MRTKSEGGTRVVGSFGMLFEHDDASRGEWEVVGGEAAMDETALEYVESPAMRDEVMKRRHTPGAEAHFLCPAYETQG